MIPESDYYHSSSQLKQEQKQQNQKVYLPPRCLELHGHRLYGEKMRSLESRLERKHKKNQCL